MANIESVFAREILDSRGNPTVEVEMSDGTLTVLAKVPSGASTGIHEALELRDGDTARFGGKGVLKAVENVNTIIAPAVLGMDPAEQETLDKKMIELDGTKNKANFGANAILGVSLAAARLAALQQNIPLWKHINNLYKGEVSLPRPMMNVINGGSHSDAGLAIQEFMLFPKLGAFEDNLRAGAETFHALKKILSSRGESVGVGDEGGFAPRLATCDDAFSVVMEAIEAAGYAGKIEIAVDAAASEFYNKESKLYTVDGKELTAAQLVDFYEGLVTKYPIVSLEDSHDEDDFEGFKLMQARMGDRVQLVGDDLFVTNPERLAKGIEDKQANSILIKVNQIGSLTETFDAMHMAHDNNFTTVVSHRSGETSDTFIADLAVGTNAGQIKTGSLSRSERIEKYNRLLQISEQL